jgi:hypothetical protein
MFWSITSQIKSALFYLVIASLLGVLLRMFAVLDIEAKYKFIVHTHSHIALLGWVYLALTSILFYIGINPQKKKQYQTIFWSTQVTLIGMLIAFPIQGYALYSIVFSTLFLICSYWFYFFFRKHHQLNTSLVSYKFINTSLLFMVLSSIGPWALGVIMNVLGNSSHWYYNAIYFYLHFQYNGWFVFCLLGLFFYALEQKGIQLLKAKSILFYKLFTISCVLTLFLSFLWIEPHRFIYIIAGIGAFLQLASALLLFQIIYQNKKQIGIVFDRLTRLILTFVGLLLVLKICMQVATAFPFFVVLTSELIDFVIGYLHLVFLGIITPTVLLLLYHFKLMQLSKIWTLVFFIGFVSSEILIFYKGITLWKQQLIFESYYAVLIYASALMPIGIIGIFLRNLFFTDSTLPKSL